MNPEVVIILYLLNKQNYLKYINYVNKYIKDKSFKNILSALDYFYDEYNKEEVSLEEFSLFYKTKYPSDTDNHNILKSLSDVTISEDVLKDVLEKIKDRAVATDLAVIALEVSEGTKDKSYLVDKFSELSATVEIEEETFVTTDLTELYDHQVKKPGLRWRLRTLNEMLGSLRQGDFGFIYARPESYSRDTEVLTPSGWVAVDKITIGTEIAQVNSDLTVSFVYPEAVHSHEQDFCYHIHDTIGRVDLIVTEGHGMVYEKDGKLYKERADQVKYNQSIKHHVVATSNAVSRPLNPMERLAIAYQADGHRRSYKDYGYTFSFKKDRKITRLISILKDCNYEYTTYKDGNRGHTGFYVKTLRPLSKDFSWVDLSEKSKEWCQEFIEELSYWDATRRTDSRFKFDTTDKEVADKVQAIAILAGYNCFLSKHIDNRKETYKPIYSLTIRKNYVPVNGQSIIKEKIPFSDTTYCFEVASGMLLVRRNGAVAVCGNTGKTTFLASEITNFAAQAESDILWFNNEEQGEKVALRLYQAALGVTQDELFRDIDKYRELYKQVTGDRIKIYDSASIHKRTVESLCESIKPSLIVFDQIDKVKGFTADREDLHLGAIYIWARELAKTYCPVIGVCQASGEGEGRMWLTMDHVSGAKTSKQAEADWILGIGKSNEEGHEYVRGLHLSKNKLTGDPDSIPDKRHGREQVLIEPHIARYKDML